MVAASEARARVKTGAGSERGTRGGSASLKKRPGCGEVALPRRAWSRCGYGRGLTGGCGCGRKVGELTGGAGRSAAEGGKGGAVVSSGAHDFGRPRKEGGRGEAGGRRWAGPRPEMRRKGRGEGAGLAGGAGRESRKEGRGKK